MKKVGSAIWYYRKPICDLLVISTIGFLEYKFGSKSWINFGLNSTPIMANWIPEKLEPSRHIRDLTNIAALFGHTKVALATPLYSLIRDVCSQRFETSKP